MIRVDYIPLTIPLGPYPEIKFSTLVSRGSKSIIEPCLLFFRTSAVSRTSPHFLRETRVIPPLYLAATVKALEALKATTNDLDIHFADEECDPYAVELAGRLRGYVVGTDSDFVILNADGYQGYIPLDELVWTTPVVEAPVEDVPNDGFQQVTNAKSRARAAKAAASIGRGVIPPEDTTDISLTCSVFQPSVLASHLSLPVTLLPLLASLVGNDFTNLDITTRLNIHQLFFERRMSSAQRIELVAKTIHTILVPTARRKSKYQVGSVMDLIDRTVHALTARVTHTMGPGQIDIVVDRVAEGALQYAIPKYQREHDDDEGLWPSRICALHVPDVCPLIRAFSRRLEVEAEAATDDEDSDEVLMRIHIRTVYLDAYRRGRFPPLLVNTLTSGTAWPRLFMENPDIETVSRLTRDIRQWTYAVLNDSLGLPEEALPTPEEDGNDSDNSDELVDVTEDESDSTSSDLSEGKSDLLAPLRGALHSLRNPPPGNIHSSSTSAKALQPQRTIIEYVRRGTRLADEEVEVPDLDTLLDSISDETFNFHDSKVPLVLQDTDVRLTVMLRALRCDIPGLRDLEPEQMLVVLVLRCVVRTLHDRAQDAGSHAREIERWTERESRCLIASFGWGVTAASGGATAGDQPQIVDRHIQLTAQMLHAYETISHFAQALLLFDVLASPVHLFSGRAFHAYLTGAIECPELPPALWEACTHGMEGTFAGESARKKKGKKAKASSASTAPVKGKQASNHAGLFGMLADMGA